MRPAGNCIDKWRRDDLLSPDSSQPLRQVFHCPVDLGLLKVVRSRAVLPDGVTRRQQWVLPPEWLCEQACQITAQQISAPALRQMRIAGTVYKDVAIGAAHQRLMSFEHDAAIAKLF